MTKQVRKISLSDIKKLRHLFIRALNEDFPYFPGQYLEKVARDNSYISFIKAIVNPNRLLLGLFNKNELIGYLIADYKLKTDSDIFWFYVIPEARGKGLGKRFFQRALKILAQEGVKHVYLITHGQKTFYENLFGFEIVSQNSELFDGITMFEMGKDLSL